MARPVPILINQPAKIARPWLLFGVDPLLAVPLWAAAAEWNAAHPEAPVVFTEGLRSQERQAGLLASGATQTMASKHLIGLAVDVAVLSDGEMVSDLDVYRQFADLVAKHDVARRIMWGGNWRTLVDGCHFCL